MRAELNENNIVFHVTDAEIPLCDRVIDVDDGSVLGKKYDAETGKFLDPEPTPEPPLTEQEQAILETAINIDYLVCLADLGI